VVGVAHKGFSAAEIVVHGRAAHGSRPADGIDAILHMGRVLARLEALDRSLQAQPPDALLGTASLHASTIDGGTELSSYPARCRLQVERRTLPGETLSAAADELHAIARDLALADPAFRAEVRLLLARDPYAIPADHWLPRALGAAMTAHGVAPDTAGVSYWTDAAILGAAGTPTCLFGPRGAGLHSIEEYVRLDDVVTCRDVLVDVVGRVCRP
jgi:acetylornithine deacetylase